MIYVDRAVHRWRDKLWCHMFGDSFEELHEFADQLGLKREWFQVPPYCNTPHYDLHEATRELAIALGAVELHSRQEVVRRMGHMAKLWREETGEELRIEAMSHRFLARRESRLVSQD